MQSFTLAGGDRIPALGLGTWKSSPGAVYGAVREALAMGYRHIDCAPIYQNEAEVGKAIADSLGEGGVRREELWLTSKLWNSDHGPGQVEGALRKTLADLQVEYLDLYLIHWPVTFKPGVLFAQRGEEYLRPGTIPIIDTWRAMEDCAAKGLARNIGVCNFSLAKLDDLLSQASLRPAVNQVELHPYLQQARLLAFCNEHGIRLTAYSPLGSGDRPAGLKKSGEPTLLDHPLILRIASKHKATPAQVLLAWGLARRTVVIPKSVHAGRMAENLASLELVLDQREMDEIAELDLGYRFVDGAFFTGGGSPYTLKDIWDA